MTKKKTKPDLRYAEFTDAWEQRKLGDIYKKVNEKNDMSFGKDKVISLANMYFKTNVYITNLEYLKTYNVFKCGDIAFEGNKSKNYSYGRFVENTIGDGIVSHVFVVFRPILMFDLWFWKYAINNERLMKNILIRSTKSSTMMTDLVISDFLKENFLVPCIKEQKIIGEFFVKIDNLITLHQREYEKLVEMKKALLEKMFPKNGENKPEIRFQGFTDAWEQRKLGDIAIEIKRTDSTSNDPVMMISASNGFINQSEKYSNDNAGLSLSKYILLSRGELAYNHGASKSKPYGSCFALKTDKARIPFVYHCFSVGENNPYFTALVLNDTKLDRQLRRLVSSGARMDGLLNISFESYKTIEIMLPKRTEQDKIYELFRHFDNLITLHQRELEKLKNMKKALLEKMFV